MHLKALPSFLLTKCDNVMSKDNSKTFLSNILVQKILIKLKPNNQSKKNIQ